MNVVLKYLVINTPMFFIHYKLYKCARFIVPTRLFQHSLKCSTSTILGIETSCDDTGCAIIDNMGTILGDSLYSQNVLHLRYGGINPIVAQNLHREHIENVVNSTLHKAGIKMNNVDAVAVTVKPGLLASLEIGVKYAKYLARKYKKCLIPIHHMEAHALVARMYYNIEFPFLVLLISGGHCLLAVVNDVEDFVLLGESLDDSPGEAFDKTARRMKLKNIPLYSQMSGGQAIETAASKATNPEQFQFPLPLLRHGDCNFSFSGLKDSVNHKLLKKEKEHSIEGDNVIPEINDLCAAFQIAVSRHLEHRTKRAMKFCETTKLLPKERKTLVISGGVACNNYIYQSLEVLCKKMGYNIYRPPPQVCVDNGIMIAWNGLEKLRKGSSVVKEIYYSDIEPKAPLGKNMIKLVKETPLQKKFVKLK